MYVWGRGGGRLLQVNNPQEVAGAYEVSTANFGPSIINDTINITAEVAIARDGSFSRPTLACDPLINAEEVEGKIAMIDRGQCFFIEKAFNAQEAGALAVIICNFENSFVPMGAPANFPETITIPSVMLKQSECQVLKALVDEGLEITLASPEQTGPDFIDGDFDNGVVAHEYAHGISTRLTGGRSNSSCLANDEEMGEGWSDFFTLITSVKPEDDGTEKRGIGTYLQRQDTDAQGVRSFPYSTDMNENPNTYGSIISTSTAPHPVGEVWAGMLWDLYWAMSDAHGWSEDLFNGTSGNNQAIQLVMDGLKLQPCRPGFVDGRDAILAADMANNGGANQCLIWEVFARRGLGFSASQGDERDRNDAIEAFDLPPSCANAVLISKAATPSINTDGEIDYTITVSNQKTTSVSEVVVSDNLPEGLTLMPGTASMTVNADGNNLRFEIPQLEPGEEMEITYSAVADGSQQSVRQFFDDLEDGGQFWLIIDEENTNLFGLQDVFVNSGENAWHVPNPEEDSEQYLQLDEEIVS